MNEAPNVLRVVMASTAALIAGVAAALIQCDDNGGVNDAGWLFGLFLLFIGIAGATLLMHRWWASWVGLALILPWVSLVGCVSDAANDPNSDGLQVLFYPLEAVATVVALAVAFALHKAAQGREASSRV